MEGGGATPRSWHWNLRLIPGCPAVAWSLSKHCCGVGQAREMWEGEDRCREGEGWNRGPEGMGENLGTGLLCACSPALPGTSPALCAVCVPLDLSLSGVAPKCGHRT